MYRFALDCGRMGELSSVFTATPEDIAASIGRRAYFGEALGKHSDIRTDLTEDHFELVTDNQEFVGMFDKFRLSTGYNPLDYLRD